MSEAPAMPVAIMEMSDKIDAIAKVLPKAQAAMGDVIKNANNPAFKSKYADLGAVIEAVVPALNDHGITLLQPASFDGELVKVGTVLLHESGQWVRCTLSAPLSKRDAQGIGSATTYLRRYGLQAMSGVAPEDDDGNAASRPSTGRQNPTSAAQLKRDGVYEALQAGIDACATLDELNDWGVAHAEEIKALPDGWRVGIRDRYAAHREQLSTLPEGAEEMDEAFRQTVSGGRGAALPGRTGPVDRAA